MKNHILTVYIYTVAYVLALVLLIPMAVLRVLNRGDPTCRKTGRLMRRFGQTVFSLMPIWKYRLEGQIPDDIGDKGYVVVANHRTTGDVFLLANVPWDMRWVAKVELMQFVPVLGQLLWLSGDIPLKRGCKESVVRMVHRAEETLRNGLSLMVFPEGTRSKTGALGPFKDGAFNIAIDTGRPVLPLAVFGTATLWPRGTFSLGQGTGVIKVLPPIPTDGLTREDMPALKEQARRAILDELEKGTGCATDAAPGNGIAPQPTADFSKDAGKANPEGAVQGMDR